MITLSDFADATDEEFMEMLNPLTEKEQIVLLLLRGVNGLEAMPREEAAKELGVTESEVGQIESKALETIERMNRGWKQDSFILVHGDGSMEKF